jgi:hypothetical protein
MPEHFHLSNRFSALACQFKHFFSFLFDCVLSTEQDAVHANIRKFACDRCPYRAKEASNLKKHQRVVHDKIAPGVKRECADRCDYVANTLTAHQQQGCGSAKLNADPDPAFYSVCGSGSNSESRVLMTKN